MLKKLVKYGNSNALILDKAILEILNIEEGSIVKLKTDGKSIIITPRTKATSGKVHDIFTHNQASIEANVEKALEKYVNIGGVVDSKLKEKVLNLKN